MFQTCLNWFKLVWIGVILSKLVLTCLNWIKQDQVDLFNVYGNQNVLPKYYIKLQLASLNSTDEFKSVFHHQTLKVNVYLNICLYQLGLLLSIKIAIGMSTNILTAKASKMKASIQSKSLFAYILTYQSFTLFVSLRSPKKLCFSYPFE